MFVIQPAKHGDGNRAKCQHRKFRPASIQAVNDCGCGSGFNDFSYTVTILWLLTIINAFNFMDNMNGLCAGLGAIGSFFFALLAAAKGEYLVAIIGFLMCGALVGFLPWNFPKGRAFLGDAGSHLVGYLLAMMAILPHFYTRQEPRPLAVLSPLLVLAIPLIDLAQVSLFRTLNRKPLWLGDTNHLSHRLTRYGMNQALSLIHI